MEIEVLKEDKKMLELRVTDTDVTLLKLIVEKLNQIKDVEFAACKLEHPTSEVQRLIVKTKKEEPLKLIQETVEEISSDIEKFAGNFKKR